MDIQESIKQELKKIVSEMGVEVQDSEIVLTPSNSPEHGDYASNLALRKAKALKMKPIDLAKKIEEVFHLDGVDHLEACMPGFLNFFLKQDPLGSIIKTIIDENEDYGNLT